MSSTPTSLRTILSDIVRGALSNLETLPNSIDVGEPTSTAIVFRLHGNPSVSFRIPEGPVVVPTSSVAMERYSLGFTICFDERATSYRMMCIRQAMAAFYQLEELHTQLVSQRREGDDCLFAYRVAFTIAPRDNNNGDMDVNVTFHYCFVPRHLFTSVVPMDAEPAAPAVR